MRTILILASNPKNTERLRLDEEVKKIELGLERSKRRDQFKLVVKWAVTDDDLRRALLDHQPEIVHFSGHGAGTGGGGAGREFIPNPKDEASGLAFEDEVGRVQLISGDALSRLFELCSDHVQCVVLNACYSEVQANAIAKHIDFVVGMTKAIGDEAAIKFGVGFYDALGAGKDYEKAFKFGCSAIDLKGIPEYLTPVLKKMSAPSSAPGGSVSLAAKSSSVDTPAMTQSPVRLFYSYSHKDKEWRDELEEHLSLLRRQGVISAWYDRQIVPGQEWANRIDEQLELAQVILLLVSPSFLASDYCYDIEMKRALERHEQGEAVVIPVIVRPCDWKIGAFSKLAALPSNWKAVTSWSNKDEAWTDVALGVRRAVEAMKA